MVLLAESRSVEVGIDDASLLQLVPVAVDGWFHLGAPFAVNVGKVVDSYLYLLHAVLSHAEISLDKLAQFLLVGGVAEEHQLLFHQLGE